MTQYGDGSGWCVVMTSGGGASEAVAERNIAALGYMVDFLWYRKKLKDRRVIVDGRRVPDNGPNSIVRRPLFPRYGFVLVPYGGDACDIDKAIGVLRILRHAPTEGDRVGKPKRFRASVAQGLIDACAAGEFDDAELRRKPENRSDLAPGAQVRFRNRSDGLVLTIRELTEEGRVRYANDLFGGNEGWLSKEDARELELVGL